MKGVMLGVVSVEGVEKPCVAIKVNEESPVVLSLSAAMGIYRQLGVILEGLGAFPEEEEEGVTLQ